MLRRSIGRVGAFVLITAIYFLIAGTVQKNISEVLASVDNQPLTIVIDAGHGGEDGGAVGVTGTKESMINLDISKRLDMLLMFCGHKTQMIRDHDCAVYTEGTSLSEKKVSDLKQRVKMVQNAHPAVLISIHQNHFSDEKYGGSQVFYAQTEGSKELALLLQSAMCDKLDQETNRTAKEAESVYLMKHISCPGVLIECGFLSNRADEARLQDPAYQKKLVCVISGALSDYSAGRDRSYEI